jgi:hypothetical protein
MATLDEISKEKQRVSEALARVDAQREKLAGQLGELEATERVLARYSKGVRARKTASARTPITPINAAAPARSGGRPRSLAAKPAGDKRSSPSLSNQVDGHCRSIGGGVPLSNAAVHGGIWRSPGTPVVRVDVGD